MLTVTGWMLSSGALGSQAGEHDHQPGGGYESGGLSISVTSVDRVSNDHHGGPMPSVAANFPMPPNMMPGMPASDRERIHVEVTLSTLADEAKPYELTDFALVSPAGDTWVANEESFTPGIIAPGYSANIDLYFDVPLGQHDLSIAWIPPGGAPVQIPLLLAEAPDAAEHHHESGVGPPPAAPPAAPPAHDHAPGEAPGHSHGS